MPDSSGMALGNRQTHSRAADGGDLQAPTGVGLTGHDRHRPGRPSSQGRIVCIRDLSCHRQKDPQADGASPTCQRHRVPPAPPLPGHENPGKGQVQGIAGPTKPVFPGVERGIGTWPPRHVAGATRPANAACRANGFRCPNRRPKRHDGQHRYSAEGCQIGHGQKHRVGERRTPHSFTRTAAMRIRNEASDLSGGERVHDAFQPQTASSGHRHRKRVLPRYRDVSTRHPCNYPLWSRRVGPGRPLPVRSPSSQPITHTQDL